jgi:hypothetical protein
MAACKSEEGAGEKPDAGSEPDAEVMSDGGVQVGPPYNSCEAESDCAWGEIDHEILKKKDCVCLYGCPYIPLSKETVERRAEQHAKLCDPRADGNGDPCGIDDCATPGALACNAGACEAAPSATR